MLSSQWCSMLTFGILFANPVTIPRYRLQRHSPMLLMPTNTFSATVIVWVWYRDGMEIAGNVNFIFDYLPLPTILPPSDGDRTPELLMPGDYVRVADGADIYTNWPAVVFCWYTDPRRYWWRIATTFWWRFAFSVMAIVIPVCFSTPRYHDDAVFYLILYVASCHFWVFLPDTIRLVLMTGATWWWLSVAVAVDRHRWCWCLPYLCYQFNDRNVASRYWCGACVVLCDASTQWRYSRWNGGGDIREMATVPLLQFCCDAAFDNMTMPARDIFCPDDYSIETITYSVLIIDVQTVIFDLDLPFSVRPSLSPTCTWYAVAIRITIWRDTWWWHAMKSRLQALTHRVYLVKL